MLYSVSWFLHINCDSFSVMISTHLVFYSCVDYFFQSSPLRDVLPLLNSENFCIMEKCPEENMSGVEFEAPTAVNVMSNVFCDLMPCSLVEV